MKPRRASAGGVAAALLLVGAATAFGVLVFGRARAEEAVMTYLLAIVLVSLRGGRVEAIVSAVASVLAFDYFFVPPLHTLAAETRHLATFVVMFAIALVISGLTQRVRDQRDRTASLYAMSRALAAADSTDAVVAAANAHLPRAFGPGAAASVGEDGAVVVAGLDSADDRPYAEAFVAQVSAAADRARLAELARETSLRVEAEELRNALLSSVSHDLRTPLAVITGTASTLVDDRLAPEVRRELAESIVGEAERLERLVRNLLDMTRLEAGAVRIEREWQSVEEVVGAALGRMGRALDDRPVETRLAPDLPLLAFDAVLVEQLLVNLLENAMKYTPPGSPIAIAARVEEGAVEVSVADRGPGIPEGEEERVFEKFQRGRGQAPRGGGVGLGLAICRAIVDAHGGRIGASRREGGGAVFAFTLPIEGEPPALSAENP